ncbi:MAG: DEAD/DEAH box helicase [Candidatus Delongbacteria bacterium]|nr:DEAD/DEAH box helicase [Candidatus Delongbacteria bacterium]MBN2837052.1 DEAD/DEAH box helicase [Candidatus Delongbacteria bacterium]
MTDFKSMGLDERILKAIEVLGFVTPTPIQQKTINQLLNNSGDMIALAQTGTGKTAAFGLPVIQKTDVSKRNIQTLILCPTRELCIQVCEDLKKFSKFIEEIRVLPVYGGAPITTQITELKRGVHIVVGTPGRVIDLINRGKLNLESINNLVLDEADEMLSMGFKDELDEILKTVPSERQTLLFSATMPADIRRIAEQYMKSVEEVVVGQKNKSNEDIEHQYFMVRAKDRYNALKRIVDYYPDIYGIVFCRTRTETKEIAAQLIEDGYNADALHGDLTQSQRDHVMNMFKIRHLQILVATDVAARGLDVDSLTHVINYNLPDDPEIYIHRSGRTGRAGKQGISCIIIHTKETGKLRQLERVLGKKVNKYKVPVGGEICEKQLYHLIDRIKATYVDESQISKYLPEIYKRFEDLSKEELLKHLVSVEFNRFLDFYKDDEDLNVEEYNDRSKKTRDFKPERNYTQPEGKFTRFYINLGSKDNLNPGRLIYMLNDNMKTNEATIGKIVINDKFSHFELDGKFEERLMSSFKNYKVNSRNIIVERAELPKDKGSSGGRKKRRRRFD